MLLFRFLCLSYNIGQIYYSISRRRKQDMARHQMQPMRMQGLPHGDLRSRQRARDTAPHLRGLHYRLLSYCLLMRYNPAYAGTTLLDGFLRLQHSIQPRVCGDYSACVIFRFERQDTTPRMRGLPSKMSSRRRHFRYNPAYAGTTDGTTARRHCG